jgi:hypothetical protein
MRAVTRLLIAAALVLGSGCAKTDWIDRTLVTVDVTGTWRSTSGVEWELNLEQMGSKVKGIIRHGPLAPSIGAGSAPLDGTVAGDVFSFRQSDGNITGETTVSGDEMNGQATLTQTGTRVLSLGRVDSSPRPASPPR